MRFRTQQPVDPHLRRWMLFVDGENFTICAQKVALKADVKLIEGDIYMPDVFVWLPGLRGTTNVMGHAYLPLQPNAIRSFYYTTVPGDEVKVNDVKQKLRNLLFSPQVFKKRKDKSKGVDIALAKDLLVHAFLNHYDVAALIAGDGDYVPLIEEVKHLGKVVYLSFFKNDGLSPELRLAADYYLDMESMFTRRWRDRVKTGK